MGTAGLVAAAGAAGMVLAAVGVALLTAPMGCVAGASAAAAVPALTGTDVSWKATLATMVGGRVVGAGVAFGPVAALGTRIGNTILTALGGAPAAVVGAGAVDGLVQVGIALETLSDVIQATAAGASAVA